MRFLRIVIHRQEVRSVTTWYLCVGVIHDCVSRITRDVHFPCLRLPLTQHEHVLRAPAGPSLRSAPSLPLNADLLSAPTSRRRENVGQSHRPSVPLRRSDSDAIQDACVLSAEWVCMLSMFVSFLGLRTRVLTRLLLGHVHVGLRVETVMRGVRPLIIKSDSP